MPVTSPRPAPWSRRHLLASVALAGLLLAQTATPAAATGQAAPAPDPIGDEAAQAASGLQPTVHWEEAVAHEHDRIAFKPGGRVTVGFKPRATDRWTVGGVKARALPAGRLDGAAMRKAVVKPAAPAVDQPIVEPSAVIDARAAIASTPPSTDGGLLEPQARVDPGALRREVFGFLPYWQVNSSSLRIQYDKISTIAYFGVGADAAGNLQRRNSNGTVTTGWSGWTSSAMTSVINQAHATGTRVVLTVQSFAWNASGRTRQQTLLTSWAARDNLARQIAAAVRDRGADGVNLDFEPLVSGMENRFVALIKQIRTKLDAISRGYQITFDALGRIGNYPIEGAVASGADAIFIMGYDYRGSSSSPVGSVAPLSRAGYDIRDTVAAYTARVSPSRLILGVPYYGRAWSTASIGVHARNISGTKYGASTTVTYVNALPFFTAHGKQYEPTEAVAWTVYRRQNCTTTYGCVNPYRQLYVDDARALGRKYDLVNGYGLRGAGIWALGYDGTQPELWNMIKAKFITDSVPPTITGRSLSAAAFSPNGDGVLDTTTARMTATGLVRWGYIVRAIVGTSFGPKLRTGTVTNKSPSFTWNGKDSTPAVVAPGRYRITLWAEDASANRSQRDFDVTVDLRRPAISQRTPRAFLTPDGDGRNDTLALSWSSPERLSGVVRIRDRTGAIQRSWSFSSRTSGTVTWDGRRPGAVVADGRYTFEVDGRDRAGNRTVARRQILVDRTIRSVTWSAAAFDPRVGQRSRASMVLRRPAVITVGIYRGSTLVKRVWTGTSVGAGTYGWTWNGRTSSGAYASAGTYRILVHATSWVGTTWYSRDVVVKAH
ncbi:MAG TPA: glycosyl hydrolase family 18 protein [Candidatus Limnocylindrales bacterium]|nr:glycosyl hydrolase family 18 protein [Candidatus Limnocylindrales bacterium]